MFKKLDRSDANYFFFYLAALGLSSSMQDLRCGMRTLYLAACGI